MTEVIGVRFRETGKTYYFDPAGLTAAAGDGVIVETARGLEYGIVSIPPREMKDEDIRHSLKKVVRVADEKDIRRHEENKAKKGRAMEICRQKIQEHGLDMKLIDVEYTFDNNKVIFYFTADGRVDFRNLVKDLASVFRMRIELRQVGVRDEAKMLGGIGCCGRSLCCATWLTNFQPVSIKMTKTQNLSLNPAKISGVCGRLMCCLKYENEIYQELRKDLPEVNERIRDAEGDLYKVIEANVLTGRVRARKLTGEKDEYGRDKLESEVTAFHKSEVERLGKERRQNQPRKKKEPREGSLQREASDKGVPAGRSGSRRGGKRRRGGRDQGQEPGGRPIRTPEAQGEGRDDENRAARAAVQSDSQPAAVSVPEAGPEGQAEQ